MDTLSLECTTTEVTHTVNGAEFALRSSAQSVYPETSLGVPVDCVPFPDNLLTISEILSPSYTPHSSYQWFYMHAAFGKNLKAQEAFARQNIFTYIPCQTVRLRTPDGKWVSRRHPIFTSYLFVLATHQQVKAFTNTGGTKYSLPYIHFVYNKADKNEFGGCSCLTIRHSAMVNFIRLAEFDTYKVHTVDSSKVHFVKDDPVIITDGVFKGIIGRVARIHNQTTVVVTLDGVVSMTTAYIPKDFMEPYVEK